MIEIISTNITSPLGLTTAENYYAVRKGLTGLSKIDGWLGVPEPITASVFPDSMLESIMIPGCTKFESIATHSVNEALRHSCISPASSRVRFILSTTKADVDKLFTAIESYYSPSISAKRICDLVGIRSEPIVVCNACISGSSAQILAKRLLEDEECDYVIVCGADCVSRFTLGGFMSFKALSPDECRPFDIERLGLNLGEAAATIIYGRRTCGGDSTWKLVSTCQTNDAYHLSAPIPDGDGICRAINGALKNTGAECVLSAINAHGTATMFNDQMESKAIERAGLSTIPANALKGYYGHTLGAAGILEAIITMESINDGLLLTTKGFEEIGVSGKINISSETRRVSGQTFLKVISGFGGCNAALLYTKEKNDSVPVSISHTPVNHVHLTPNELWVDGVCMTNAKPEIDLLSMLYKEHVGDYPKFYKMDGLSKLTFIATEMLVKSYGNPLGKDTSVFLFNQSSSIDVDRKHVDSICDSNNFFPSPSVFLYTLPNISIGEIAIRNGIQGETTLLIVADKNVSCIESITASMVKASASDNVICGWIDYKNSFEYEADIRLFKKN